MGRVNEVVVTAPAKLNLFLAITGRRPDGFHDLVSVVAQLDFGDTLRALVGSGFSLSCSDPEVPTDDTNLVLRAAATFAASGRAGLLRLPGAHFSLEKRIPMGAGFGGGSSDAVAALRALNELAGAPANPAELAGMAAGLGSDCALFLHDGPVVMRGRGERVEPLSSAAATRLRGRRVLLFKPAFGIPTPWAYGQLLSAAAAAGDTGRSPYLAPRAAEERLAAWLNDSTAPAERLLYNNMEPPAFAKFIALPVLLEQLRRDFGLAPRMSGSGSGCFAFLPEDAPAAEIMTVIRRAWGNSAFVVEARLR